MSMHAGPAPALGYLVRTCLALSLLLASGPAKALNCAVFPPDNPWNQRVDSLPVHPRSADYVASMGADLYLHADFGSYAGYGIPYNVVGKKTPRVQVKFVEYGAESDRVPYPIPVQAQDRGRQRQAHAPGRRPGLQALRALPRQEDQEGLAGGLGCCLRPARQHLPPGRLDLRRRRRPAHLPGPRALRGGGPRCDPPRAPLHRGPHPARLHPPRPPLGLLQHRPDAAAHGPARADEGGLRHELDQRPGPRDRRSPQALRPHPRRQRHQLVHHRHQPPELRRRGPGPAQARVPASAFEAVDTGPLVTP